jgi:hypothetical protein
MAKYTKIFVKLPDLNRTFVSGKINFLKPSEVEQNVAMLNRIKTQYGALIKEWGKEFEIDESIITSFIATESGGESKPPKDGAVARGLMGLTSVAVWETLVKWKYKVNSPLSDKAKAFFDKKLPNLKNINPNAKANSSDLSAIWSALAQDEFNIACGVATIRWLIEAFKENGTSPLNKTLLTYNWSYYASRNLIKGNVSSESMVMNTKFPKESRNYLLKQLGVNGFMYLYEKKIVKN